MTPGKTPSGGAMGGTPVRDRLAINPEDGFEASDNYQNQEMKERLKMGLSALPTPKDDFEIVVPENEEVEMKDDESTWIEDQADIDQLTEEEFKKRREAELRRRSQAVQRDLPRPLDMNDQVLRPMNSDLTDLQKAEELIKREMLVMLHHDCLETPTAAQMGEGNKKKGGDRAIVNETSHRNYLDKHPYQQFSEEEIGQAKELLSKEMDVVKEGMRHGEVSLEAFTQVM